MPLASPPGRPDVVYGFGRIDASGWVADRVTIAALGWRGGDRLTLTAEAGVMIARRGPRRRPRVRCLRSGPCAAPVPLPDLTMCGADHAATLGSCLISEPMGDRGGEDS